MKIELSDDQWRAVLACLAKQPWEVSNSLIMAIGGQMQRAAQTAEIRVDERNSNEAARPEPTRQ